MQSQKPRLPIFTEVMDMEDTDMEVLTVPTSTVLDMVLLDTLIVLVMVDIEATTTDKIVQNCSIDTDKNSK